MVVRALLSALERVREALAERGTRYFHTVAGSRRKPTQAWTVIDGVAASGSAAGATRLGARAFKR